MTARVIPIRRVGQPSCWGVFRSPQSDAENGCESCSSDSACAAAVLAERAALALMCAPSMANGYRAEIIRAAAAGDQQRVQQALEAWNEQR